MENDDFGNFPLYSKIVDYLLIILSGYGEIQKWRHRGRREGLPKISDKKWHRGRGAYK